MYIQYKQIITSLNAVNHCYIYYAKLTRKWAHKQHSLYLVLNKERNNLHSADEKGSVLFFLLNVWLLFSSLLSGRAQKRETLGHLHKIYLLSVGT